MSNPIKQTKQFCLTDQQHFAVLSGDFNPIHLNSEMARREIFGEVVVHGIHLILTTLDMFARHSSITEPLRVTGIKAKFFSPAFLERELLFTIDSTDNQIKAEIRDIKQQLLTVFSVEYTAGIAPSEPLIGSLAYPFSDPVKRELKNLDCASGNTSLTIKTDLCGQLLPDILRLFSIVQIAELLAYTRIVGMNCPGLNSLFSGIDVTATNNSTNTVSFSVQQVIEKFSIISLAVTGPTLSGSLSTLFRPSVIQQPSIREVAENITPGSLKGMRALVIGGSRGIGETTAKMIAAGGGSAVITYYMGKRDADKICHEVQEAGFTCEQQELSISDIGKTLEKILPGSGINTIFYYPTPKISKSSIFDVEQLHSFNFYYVDQFDAMLTAVRAHLPFASIFYPSTVAIDEENSGLKEYVMAKVAGEYLCKFYNRDVKNLSILVHRLPRLETDQTLNLQNYPAESVITVIRPIIEKMYQYISKFID